MIPRHRDLADPSRERLTRRPPTDRPPAEFSPHIRVLVYLVAALGVILAVAVISYVAVHVWRLP